MFARPAAPAPAAGMTGIEPGPRGQDAAAIVIQGDLNCDTAVNAVDSLQILRSATQLSISAGCLADGGDVNCDSTINTEDALLLLRYAGGLSVQAPDGCATIGEVVTPEAAAHALAQRIVHPVSLLAEVHSVEQALSRAGVASGTFGQILVPARDPATPEVDLPAGVLNLALEANGGTLYRMTAADFGQMLADFRWPFADGAPPGEQVVAMLTALINGAHESPDDPVSFGALLLDELAKLKDPSLDLTAGTPAPEDVRLNLLDLKLVSSLFDRVSIKSAPPAAAAPADADPCSDAKKWISGATGPFGGEVYGLSTGQTGPALVERGLEAAGVSNQNAGNVGKGLAALSIASKIWKLVEFYSTAQVNVTTHDGPKIVHKALDSEPPQLRIFDADAGVSDADWQEYVNSFDDISQETNRAVRDCLNEFGLSVPADLGEIARDAESWKIEWSVYAGVNSRNERNAYWTESEQDPGGSRHLGKWQTTLKKVSDYSAGASFWVDIGTERQSDHPGPQKLDDVNVCADVISATPPNLQTFFNATQGILGLVDAIVELGAGWLQTVAPPHACSVLGVTWHEKCASAPQSADAETSPASQAQRGETVSIEAITSLDELPCAWEGTATATYTESNMAVDLTTTVTASGLRFERDALTYGNGVSYHAVAGQVSWTLSGSALPDCTYSGSGTYSASANNSSPDPYAREAHIVIWEEGGGAPRYEGQGQTFTEPMALLSCSEFSVEVPASGANMWFYAPEEGAFRLEADGSMTGSFSTGVGPDGEQTAWQWNLHAAECQPSPEPVCQ